MYLWVESSEKEHLNYLPAESKQQMMVRTRGKTLRKFL